jgi:hypothetical protein
MNFRGINIKGNKRGSLFTVTRTKEQWLNGNKHRSDFPEPKHKALICNYKLGLLN